MNSQEYLQETIQDKLRRQAYLRKPQFGHPQLKFTHNPIKGRQCQQLQQQLAGLIKPRIDEIKRHYDLVELETEHEKQYKEFAISNYREQNRQKQMCLDIKQMHQMSQMLLQPPSFDSNTLYLYEKKYPSQIERQQLNNIFKKYQKAYEAKQRVEQDEAQQTIKKAKLYLLKDYEDTKYSL